MKNINIYKLYYNKYQMIIFICMVNMTKIKKLNMY